jgi:PadR family transcriptional regulator, regulatory protein PadR
MVQMNLTYATTFILRVISQGRPYGFEIMDATGLPSGTVYPALRRLEACGLVRGAWDKRAGKGGGPSRRRYQITKAGQEFLSQAEERFPLFGTLTKR